MSNQFFDCKLKDKCNSFYKEAFLNRKLFIEQLQQENQRLNKQLDYLRSGEYLNQLKFEVSMLEHIVANGEVSEEDKKFIDMAHRNTQLLEENQKMKEVIDKTIKNINMTIEIIKKQPTGNDDWILKRLNSFKYILQGEIDE